MSKLLERLRDPVRSGVYRVTERKAIADAVKGTTFDVAEVDLAGGDALQAFAAALRFPDWFGNNWDALEDCLGDLSWRTGEGHVLLLRDWQAMPSDHLGVLIDVLGSSAEFWCGRRRPFFAVLVDPDRKLALPALYRDA